MHLHYTGLEVISLAAQDSPGGKAAPAEATRPPSRSFCRGADLYTQSRGQPFSCRLHFQSSTSRRARGSVWVSVLSRFAGAQTSATAGNGASRPRRSVTSPPSLSGRVYEEQPLLLPHPSEEAGGPPVTHSGAVTGRVGLGNRNLKGPWGRSANWTRSR